LLGADAADDSVGTVEVERLGNYAGGGLTEYVAVDPAVQDASVVGQSI